MNPRLLAYYNRELQHLRETGGEFAAEFPKIAGRLALDGFECADPYVERLLEAFSFLAARVQLKIDAEFPVFTQHLLEIIYPQYLAPTPSMAVVQFQPKLSEGSLRKGVTVPRDTALRSQIGEGEQTPCEYRTAHEISLWPLELQHAEYFSRNVPRLELPEIAGVRAAIHLRLKATGGTQFKDMPLDKLPIFLRGSDDTPMRLYEQLLANALAVVYQPVDSPGSGRVVCEPNESLNRVGFDDSQALLPVDRRSFPGNRLLQEYFTLPSRFQFVEFSGIQSAAARCPHDMLDVIVLLKQLDAELEHVVSASNFGLFCSPAVNLFRKTADRIQLSDRYHEYHVVPDRSRPMDFEVCRITSVSGFGAESDETRPFQPFYAAHDTAGQVETDAHYVIHRRPRVLSEKQRVVGSRSSYVGTEVFVSLVDSQAAPYADDVKQLGLSTLCSNRDLPLHMPIGQGKTDFTLQVSLPVQSVRCLTGPSAPRASYVCGDGETIWRLINHLSLNYLSLADSPEGRGAGGLRQLLKLYADVGDAASRKQVEGVRSIASQPVVRRSPQPGPIAFSRGLQLTLTLDESAFEGTGAFLLGAVMDEYFGQYVSVNSFTETVFKTVDRGEIIRWPTRIGRRKIL